MAATLSFIRELAFADLPPEVVAQAKTCLLDLVGVAASGIETDLSAIVRDHAVRHFGAGEGGGARLLFDGRRASPAGAAFAGAFTIDAFDAHDGHPLTKGHAGVALLPALLAFAESTARPDGRDMLAALAMGYEVAIRAGIALHAGAADYHTSGAWNALGCAAIGARYLGLAPDATRHALGVAEYHGPRSPMMRVIAHPTMLKDGSGWGALAGVSAAYLAADGFSGAPAALVEGTDQPELWSDLGRRWRILELYFKPQPVCRWAQPAIAAALELLAEHRVDPGAIEAVQVETFAHAVALGTQAPATTEEAQYALGFPLAAALAKGSVGAREITGFGLSDEATLAMLSRIQAVENSELTGRFPAERLARVRLRTSAGAWLASPITAAPGDASNPLSDAEIRQKFAALAAAVPAGNRLQIEGAIDALDRAPHAGRALLELLAQPIRRADGPRFP